MINYKRRAEWVWRQRGGFSYISNQQPVNAKIYEEVNRFVYFRKSFEITGDIQSAMLDVSADARYQLFVNGHMVGRGPARCNSDWQYYDSYDIKPFLRQGQNVIASLVRSYGRHCAWYELPRWEAATGFGCGGWFAQGDIVIGTGVVICLDTNTSWKHKVAQAWVRETENGPLGFSEEYDARLAPQNWTSACFDESTWMPPQILRISGKTWGGNDIVPFPVMVKRPIPYMLEEIHEPVSIVRCGEVQNISRTDSIALTMHQEIINDLKKCKVTKLQTILQESGEMEIVTTADHSVSVTLDFGKTQMGRVCFGLDGPAGAIVDFCYTEQLQPDGRVADPNWSFWGIDKSDKSGRHIYSHRVILSGGPLDWEMFDWGGFRYLQITFRNCLEPLHVKRIGVNFTSYPVGYRGQFQCSDEMLTKAYQISGYTLQCCMLDSYMDCPSREQRQWTNDQYVHIMSNFGMFGDPHLARQALVQIAQSQRHDGQVMMCAPGDFSIQNLWNCSEFTLHWIMSFPQYVCYTGDTNIISELYPSIVKGVGWFERFIDEDGLLNDVPGFLWIDWSAINKYGQSTELNCRFIGCLRIAAEFSKRLGISYEEKRFTRLADIVSAAINKHLWDEQRGVYVDARRNGIQNRRVSQESSTAAMFFEVAPKERWTRILEYILDEKRIYMTTACIDWKANEPDRPPFDPEVNVVLQHAFYMHFLHAVLAKQGRFDDIVYNIRRWWGPQIEQGVATWQEHWNLSWNQLASLCHAFLCTPGFDLPSYILGVTPLDDGFERFQIAPHLVGLPWAKGVFPSIKGDISVDWQLKTENLRLILTVPAKTQAQVIIPEIKDMQIQMVEVNGHKRDDTNLWLESGTYKIIIGYVPV